MKETLNSYSTSDILTEGEVEVNRIMKTNPGFCPVPWKHTAINNNGDFRMCVQANTHRPERGVLTTDNKLQKMRVDSHSITDSRNASLLKEVRKDMLEGNRSRHCLRCNREDDANQRSRRDLEINLNFKEFTLEDAQAVTAEDGSIKHEDVDITSSDIRLSNFCNLKCRMCGPTESHSWYDDWTMIKSEKFESHGTHLELEKGAKNRFHIKGVNPFAWVNNVDIYKMFSKQTPGMKEIHISGGEPLIIQEHYKLLETYVNEGVAKNIKLDYNTNFTNIPQKFLDIWPNFREVDVGGSIDGYGPLNDYIRAPSKFSALEKTINTLDKKSSSNVRPWFTHTVQIQNIFYITELIQWVIEQDFVKFNRLAKGPFFTHHPVHNPTTYNIQSLPESTKKLVKDKIENWCNTWWRDYINNLPDDWQMGNVSSFDEIIKVWDNDKEVLYKFVCDDLQSIVKFMYGGKTNYNSLVTYYRETLELDRVRGEDIMTVNPVVFEDVKTYINKVDNNKKMILSKIGHKKLLPNLNFAQVLSPTDLIENDLVRSKHNAVYDFEFKQALTDAPWKEWLSQDTYFECKEEYLEKIHNWLHDTKNNSLTGLENFEHHDLIHGTTQAFDEAYFRYKERRLRVFRGEYAYHRRVFTNHLFINTATDEYVDTIDENDWVIISVPFCGTGGLPPQHYQQVLDDALKVGAPVLIDCAWYGTCYDMHIDLNHPAITEVCFSLTKGLGIGNLRTGIRYSNYGTDDQNPIRQQNEYNHLPLGAAQIGIHMMETFNIDRIPDKYKQWQHDLCGVLGLEPANCIHIGMADKHSALWDKFFIDEMYKKVGLRESLKAIRKQHILIKEKGTQDG